MEQLCANAHVQARHAQGEQAASGSSEDSAPEGHPKKLEGGLLELVPVRLNGGIVNDLAGVVWHQGLAQCSCCAWYTSKVLLGTQCWQAATAISKDVFAAYLDV